MAKARSGAYQQKKGRNPESFDVIIIGMGMAGLTAAIFLGRANVRTLVLGDIRKSQLASAADVGNYPGLNHKTGMEILEASAGQAKEYGASVSTAEVVSARRAKDGEGFVVKTADGKLYSSRYLVIATGIVLKPAGIPGEKELLGKGVHSCVACDGWAYRGKKVFVIGNTSYAAEEALQLTAYTRDVTILSDGREFEISGELVKELEKAGIRTSKDKVRQLKGKARLESVVLADGTELKPDGVFLAIGTATALSFSQSLAIGTDRDGFIRIDKDTGRTDIDGVYAAGGCTGGNQQIAKSIGEGCNAAIDIIKRLKGLSHYADQT